jgi:hypothetical protein
VERFVRHAMGKYATEYLIWFFHGSCGKRTAIREIFFLLILLGVYLYFELDVLSGKVTYYHDGILWYGMFHYFVESLWSGFLPTWNPYVHMGEPFYYAWGILRLLDPVTLSVISIGKIFQPSVFDLYHYNYIIRIIITFAGLYLFYKRIFERFLSTYIVLIIGLASAESGLLTVGTIDSFCWLPWAMYFLLRMLDKVSRYDLFFFTYFVGIIFGAASYHWALSYYFIAVFLVSLFFKQRAYLKQIFKQDKLIVIVSVLLFVGLSAPLLSLFPERSNIVPIAREHDRNTKKSKDIISVLGVDYGKMVKRDPEIGLGSYDYIFRFLPYGRHYEFPQISYIARILFVIGLIFGIQRFKYNFLALTIIMYILYIGPYSPLSIIHKVFYFSFPPLWLVRHMSLFDPFVYFSAVIFIGLGADVALSFFSRRSRQEGNHAESTSPQCGNRITELILDYFHSFHDNSKWRLMFIYYVLLIMGAALFLFYIPMRANIFTHFFITHASYSFFFYILLFWVASVFIFCFFFPKTNYLLPILLAFSILVVEQFIITNHLSEEGHNKQGRAKYFDGFTFNKEATSKWKLPDKRVAGLNLKKTYLAYSPTILKINTAFDDLLNDTIARNFNTIFSQGLYHFWLKPYLKLYEIGEINPLIFRHLTGINGSPIGFYPHVMLKSPEDQDAMFKKIYYTASDNEGVSATPQLTGMPYANFKNGSFELWDAKKSALVHWNYSQAGKGGAIKRNTDSNDVKDGLASVMLFPSSNGASIIRQTIPIDSNLDGKYIQFSAWVKSGNAKKEAIQLDIQDGSDVVSVSYCYNKNVWEQVTVAKLIRKDAKYVHLTLAVNSFADAPAVFDNTSLIVLDKESVQKVEADRSLLNSNGINLNPINSKIPSVLNKAVFISEPIEPQFRHLEVNYPITPDESIDEVKSKTKPIFDYKVISYIPTHIKLEVNAYKDGIILFRDAYDDHWEAFVDGEKKRLYKANLAFKAVPLNKGTHVVVFDYNPKFFIFAIKTYMGIHVFLIFLGTIVLLRKLIKR